MSMLPDRGTMMQQQERRHQEMIQALYGPWVQQQLAERDKRRAHAEAVIRGNRPPPSKKIRPTKKAKVVDGRLVYYEERQEVPKKEPEPFNPNMFPRVIQFSAP